MLICALPDPVSTFFFILKVNLHDNYFPLEEMFHKITERSINTGFIEMGCISFKPESNWWLTFELYFFILAYCSCRTAEEHDWSIGTLIGIPIGIPE